MRLDRVKLKIMLLRSGMKQQDLALKSGLTRATISNVCNGKSCTDATGRKIAAALGVHILDILETGLTKSLE